MVAQLRPDPKAWTVPRISIQFLKGPGKANLMAVWIGKVEVALAPFGIRGRGVRVERAGRRHHRLSNKGITFGPVHVVA